MSASVRVDDEMSAIPDSDSTPATPMPTPSSAVRIGMPAASSDPKVTTSTTSATTRPIASVGPASSSGCGERAAGQGDLVPVGLEARRGVLERRRWWPPGRRRRRRVNCTSTYMTLPSGATAWAVTGSETATTSSRARRRARARSGRPGCRCPVRNDSPSGAATTTRALDGVAALLRPTAAVRADAGGLVAQPLRDERLRPVGLGARDGERVREVQPGRDARRTPAAASTSSHATSTIQRWRKLPRPRRSSTRAMFTPWSTVQDTRQVSVTCRWHHGSGDDPGRRRPGGSAGAAHTSAAPGCPALARTGTQPRRDLRRRRRRPGHREPQHLLPALPRHRHAAGRRPRRAGRPRRRRPHPDPPRDRHPDAPRRAGPVRHPRRRERRPLPQRAGRARLPRRRHPPAPAHRGARRPRASSCTARPRARAPARADRRGRARRVGHRRARRVAGARPAAPRAGRGVLGVVGRQRLARGAPTPPPAAITTSALGEARPAGVRTSSMSTARTSATRAGPDPAGCADVRGLVS